MSGRGRNRHSSISNGIGSSSGISARGRSSNRSADMSVNDCVQDWNGFKKTTEKVFEWYGDIADQMMEFPDLYEDGFKPLLEEMEKELVGVATLDLDIKNVTNTLEGFRQTIQEPDLEADTNMSEQFMRKLEETRHEDISDPTTHPLLVAYKRTVSTLVDGPSSQEDEGHTTILMDEGEGLGMGRVERSTICPLTRVTMVLPMRNNLCGHTYSKDAILSHIRNVLNKRNKMPQDVRCPVGGCPSVVAEENLERDEDMEKQLKKEKRQQQKQQRR